jgi:hypothetical protein
MIGSMNTRAAMVSGGAVELGGESWFPLTVADVMTCAVPAVLLLALVWMV